MSRVDRRVLAWIVSVGLGCAGVAVAVRAIWPGVYDVFSSGAGGGGFASTSVGFPSLVALPFVVGNIALSVIARRRGGRAASIGSFCLWALGILAVLSLALLVAPPALVESLSNVLFFGLLLVLAIATSLPVQLIVLALLTFALIGGPRTQRAAGN